MSSFRIAFAEENPTLMKLQVGDTITITALVQGIEQESVEITRLGDEQPKYIPGSRSIAFTVQEIT